MRISDVLSKDLIMTDLKARTKMELLEEMSFEMSCRVDGLNRAKILEALLEREKLGSTGIGHGVAIPHAKLKGIDSIVVAFGRSKLGVPFQSTDGKQAHLFFLIIAPENSTSAHLKALGGISRLLLDSEFRQKLIKAETAEELSGLIREEEDKASRVAGSM